MINTYTCMFLTSKLEFKSEPAEICACRSTKKSFREVDELARGAIGKERDEGETGARGRGGEERGGKKVIQVTRSLNRWNFVLVCWIVLDGQLYI